MKHVVVGFRYVDQIDVTIWNYHFKNKKEAEKILGKVFDKPKFDDKVILFAIMEVDENSIVDLNI